MVMAPGIKVEFDGLQSSLLCVTLYNHGSKDNSVELSLNMYFLRVATRISSLLWPTLIKVTAIPQPSFLWERLCLPSL